MAQPMSSKPSEELGLTDEQITSLIADPSTIETHEIALEVIGCLDAEIANIQAQVDAAMIEATIRPLSEERQGWVRRASYAAAMKRNERHKVYQRDKEIRGVKGRAFTEPKHSKEEKLLKQQRLMVEAETRRDAKKLALAQAKTKEMEFSLQLRQCREAATQLDALQEKVKEADEACQRLCRDHGFATGHGDRVADMIDEISAQIRKIIYVPGSWHCPKCKFTLLQSNLNAQDGTVTARDTSGDKCPNCDGPLWRCTWKNDAFEMQERAVEQMERAKAAESRATRAEQERDEAYERAAKVAEGPIFKEKYRGGPGHNWFHIKQPGLDHAYGNGRLDAAAAIRRLAAGDEEGK